MSAAISSQPAGPASAAARAGPTASVSTLPSARAAAAASPGRRRSLLRRVFRRRSWGRASTAMIGAGAFMLMQPFWFDLFRYSFVVLLAGVVGLTIAGKLPR